MRKYNSTISRTAINKVPRRTPKMKLARDVALREEMEAIV